MKLVTLLVTALVTYQAHAGSINCDTITNLNPSQHNNLQTSYQIGTQYNLGPTLAAISFVESTAGMHLENTSSTYGGGSYGSFMLLLGNVLKREGGKRYKNLTSSEVLRITPRKVKRNYINRLKNDIRFSAAHAISELQYWRERTRSKKSMLAAYNGGYNALSKPSAVTYSNKVSRVERLFATCGYKFK